MLADTEEVDAIAVCDDRLFDHISNDLWLGEELPILGSRDIPERVEAEFESICHFRICFVFRVQKNWRGKMRTCQPAFGPRWALRDHGH